MTIARWLKQSRSPKVGTSRCRSAEASVQSDVGRANDAAPGPLLLRHQPCQRLGRIPLRVYPGSWGFLTELSDHQADGRTAQEGEAVLVQALPILGEAAASVQPADGALDDPAPRQHNELVQLGPLDDLKVDLAAPSPPACSPAPPEPRHQGPPAAHWPSSGSPRCYRRRRHGPAPVKERCQAE